MHVNAELAMAMTKVSFMSFAGLMETLIWLVLCSHRGGSTGIYYSRHNYAVGCFVSQSIRSQLFIRLLVIALCWRLASHTLHTRDNYPPRRQKQILNHAPFSLAIYHYKNKRKLQEKHGDMTIAPSSHVPPLSF